MIIQSKKNRRFRATTKARGNCSPECQGRIYRGYGKTEREAKRNAEAACQNAGCHTPGGTPYNCNCGHTTSFPDRN